VGVLGLVLAAALAAIMSTASAGLLASSTILANDVYAGLFRRGGEGHAGAAEYNASRLATLLVGVVVLAISVIVSDVVGALTVAYDLLVGALFVPIIGALFWRRATGTGALASMLVGGVVVVGLMAWQGLLANSPIYGGLLACLVTFVVVSLLTPGASEREASAWEQRMTGQSTT
jgi:SSS family solute:Na+ symporter